MDNVVYKWLPIPVEIDRNVDIPDFSIANLKDNDCSLNYSTGNTVKPVCNDHLYNKIYYLWFIQ